VRAEAPNYFPIKDASVVQNKKAAMTKHNFRCHAMTAFDFNIKLLKASLIQQLLYRV